jgi:branched-chain amino acid transport system ATP-binding protein
MAAVLTCQNISVSYGAFRALNGISAEFHKNSTCAIIGPNGAGKTTLLNVMSGLLRPSSGKLLLNDRPITGLPTEQRAMLGIGRSFQIAKIFPEMTARQNLRIGAQRKAYTGIQPFWVPAGHDRLIEKDITDILRMVRLEQSADIESGRLSHGSQRALEIGLTLVTKPEIILLDEPLAGIGHHELSHMVQLIKEISRDKTVVIIEHNMDAVIEIAEEMIVLVSGEVIARGEQEAVCRDPFVRKAYLGT